MQKVRRKDKIVLFDFEFFPLDQDHQIFVPEEDNVFADDVNVKQQQLK
jgi:hypothetical protein